MNGAPILTVAQMRAAEQALFDAGIEPYALMLRAGEGAAELIWRIGHKRDTLVLCGPGNNGGDGFVIARTLKEMDVPVRVAMMGESQTESARKARADWDGPVEALLQAGPATQVVDALFGIGLTRGLAPEVAAKLAELVNAAQHSFAIEVPSGVESDAATPLSPVPHFTHCLALGAWKPAHMLMPTRALAAQQCLIDIGIMAPRACATALVTPHFETPAQDAHKYKRGLVAVVAGDMPGAAALSAEAAARAGAGYVRLLSERDVPALSQAIVRSNSRDFDRAKVVLVGPGLGRDASARERLTAAMAAGVPIVVDADALWLLAERGHDTPLGTAILTPHEGEFTHVFGEGPGNKIDRTQSAAAKIGQIIVHKGTDTVIATPDGRCVVAPAASPWLSTAGTGDVLAGLCAARLAVTGDPFRAACEAVWLHGDAARRSGPGFIADDLITYITPALASQS